MTTSGTHSESVASADAFAQHRVTKPDTSCARSVADTLASGPVPLPGNRPTLGHHVSPAVDATAMRTGSHPTRRRLLGVAVTVPTLGSTLGIDGGAIFQILAVQELGLGPAAIGVGLALSAASIPFQLAAARMPLARAVPNIRLFLAGFAAQILVVAALVAFAEPGGVWAHGALAVAVVAEIWLSVLWATSWQPFLSSAVDAPNRQWINSTGRAWGNLVMIGAVIVLGAAGGNARVAILVAVAAVALGLTRTLAPMVPQNRQGEETSPDLTKDATAAEGQPALGRYLVAIGILAAGALPLVVTFAAKVMWPTANLGLIAAVEVAGAIVTSLLWRHTDTGLGRRARWGSVALVICVGGFLVLDAPVNTRAEQVTFVAATAGSMAAITVIRLAILELVHASLTDAHTVRALPVFDVVASTSAQIGFLAAGLLIAASETSDWLVDPYRLYLGVMAVLLAAAVARLRPITSVSS